MTHSEAETPCKNVEVVDHHKSEAGDERGGEVVEVEVFLVSGDVPHFVECVFRDVSSGEVHRQ